MAGLSRRGASTRAIALFISRKCWMVHMERTATPLMFKRLLEVCLPERLRELKQSLDRDMVIDRAAILSDWRRQHKNAAVNYVG